MSLISLPYSFIADSTALASQVNANFSAITTVINGQLNYLNILEIDYRAASTQTWGAGITGDTNPRIVMTTSGELEFGSGSIAPDVGLMRSAANTLQLEPAGATFDLNNGNIMGGALPTPGCRLTGVTGTPIADISSTSNVYVTPVNGGTIPYFISGTQFGILQLPSDLTITLSALTSGLPYDIFIENTAGSWGAVSPLAWTNATTRATALTNIAGMYLNSANTNQVLVGTILPITSSTVGDYTGYRGISNVYNVAPRAGYAQDTTSTWTYSSATVRASNANTTNGQGRVTFVSTLANNAISVSAYQGLQETVSSNSTSYSGFAMDSTTAYDSLGLYDTPSQGGNGYATSSYVYSPQLGSHYVQRLESADGTHTTTFFGTISAAGLGGNHLQLVVWN